MGAALKFVTDQYAKRTNLVKSLPNFRPVMIEVI
jgi:hypothetical protein